MFSTPAIFGVPVFVARDMSVNRLSLPRNVGFKGFDAGE